MKEKKYWKGLDELNNTEEFQELAQKEFADYLPVKETRSSNANEAQDASRRDFLKLMGFSMAAVSLAACETPVKKAIPYAVKPEDVDPGVPNYYASTYVNGNDYASVLVKTREGRPIKVEGNKLSSINGGGVSARVSASVLNLYDSARLSSFVKIVEGEEVKLEKAAADKEIMSQLSKLAAEGKAIRIVSPTIISPSFKAVVNKFITKYPTAKHVVYDEISYNGLAEANGGVVPAYAFNKADVVVSFSADFQGTWLSPTEFAKQFSEKRKVSKDKKTMAKHYQVEGKLSLTGANADKRFPVKPSLEPSYIIALYNELGGNLPNRDADQVDKATIKELAKALKGAQGKSIVVSGSNSISVQAIVAAINEKLGNYGKTIDKTKNPMMVGQGDDLAMYYFAEEVKAGKVGAAIFYNSNPVYSYPKGTELAEALANVPLKVSLADRVEETSSVEGTYICPDNHYLESWGDAQPRKNTFSLIQPTITPVFKGTRAAAESFMAWAGVSGSFYEFVKAYWLKNLVGSEKEWEVALHDGVLEKKGITVQEVLEVVEDAPEVAEVEQTTAEVPTTLRNAAIQISNTFVPSNEGQFDLELYESVALGKGDFANNPWLQELPDPISKVTWDNYVTMSQADADKFGVKDGDLMTVKALKKAKIQLPVLVQPGQAEGSIAIALGYGREKVGSKGTLIVNGLKDYNNHEKLGNIKKIGVNAYPFVDHVNGTFLYQTKVALEANPGLTYKLARTQTSQTIMGRDIVQETSLSDYKKKLSAGERLFKEKTIHGENVNEVDLWKYHDKGQHPIHKWGLTIDLNACTGCSACMISCQSENNVPVVGKDEVARRREMHWLRIDRYYASEATTEALTGDNTMVDAKKEAKATNGLGALRAPAANPQVVFQPMMCHHCASAPCETVCPVAATNHSTEGLNQMAYNRCIGTRYCANNCPYKVRRFNWFNYSDSPQSTDREFSIVNRAMNDELGRMVLNPDVVVRARGVMEKCSMCVQRIQAGKLQAKMERRKVKDGEITTACASVCPTNAITFGDTNDNDSKITKVTTEENKDRNYHVLEEIGVKPGVSYLAKIRNLD